MKFTFDTWEKANEFVEAVIRLYQITGVVKYNDVLSMMGIDYYPIGQGVGWTDVSSFLVDNGSIAEHEFRVYADDPVELGKSKEVSEPKKTDTWAKDTVEAIKGNNLSSANDALESFNKGLEALREKWKVNEEDPVNHPAHYKTKNGLETIQVIEAFTDGLMGIEATDTGNVIKYICRWKKKNGLEDLKKAQWYLNHLIKHVEKENEES